MTAPTTQIVQMTVQNPDASEPLIIPVAVVCNTSDEALERNIRVNSARNLEWIARVPAHDGVAVLVGGGPSLADGVVEIDTMQAHGATVFAMNGASRFLNEHGVFVDYQVIADAKPESAELVDEHASGHLFASQVHPDCIDGLWPRLWHLEIGNIERLFPPERVERGGYSLIGGGAAVGNAACVLAWVMGFRELHLFGYDSSNRAEETHAYDQPMNRFIPQVEVEWAGRKFISSVAMKAQAEKFMLTGQALVQNGCKITVHGDGLLPTMWNTPASELGEREKYRTIWQFDAYREVSPGQTVVFDAVIRMGIRLGDTVIDFGCGTGRAAVELAKAGRQPLMIDFADNCRDEEAMKLPFLEWDLSRPIPASARYGLCADVLEHIPTDTLPAVIRNIMAAAETVYFQASTVPDNLGALLQAPLHMTVRPATWWLDLFRGMGYSVGWNEADDNSVRLIARREAAPEIPT